MVVQQLVVILVFLWEVVSSSTSMLPCVTFPAIISGPFVCEPLIDYSPKVGLALMEPPRRLRAARVHVYPGPLLLFFLKIYFSPSLRFLWKVVSGFVLVLKPFKV